MKIELKSIFEKPECPKRLEVSYEKASANGYETADGGKTEITAEPMEKGRYRLTGNGSVTLFIPCARCLSPVRTDVSYAFSYDCSRENGTDEDGEQLPFLLDEETIDTDLLIESELTQAVPGPLQGRLQRGLPGLREGSERRKLYVRGAVRTHAFRGCDRKGAPGKRRNPPKMNLKEVKADVYLPEEQNQPRPS